jgi:transcriptional regulator with XRE-family HTH domain
MNLLEIGHLVRERRAALGLSQDRLARLSDLSRATVNQLENGSLADLGVAKLAHLLDLLGLRLEAGAREAPAHGLRMACRTASVSYRTALDSRRLADALASGELPVDFIAHVSTLLDEAPLPVVVGAVEEAARLRDVPPKRIWQHLARWAHELRSPRPAWA